MKRITYYFLFAALLSSTSVGAQNSIMHLTQSTLMHEVRETPSPLDGQHITMNPPRFMWPDKFPHLGAVLDGVEGEEQKPHVTYRIRIARDNPDIREARIDPTLPVNERLRLFAAAIGDPHRFRVGDTEVEVLFDDSAPSLQACLTGMCRQLQ